MSLGTQITLINNTASQINYLGGIITVPASGTKVVNDSLVWFLYFDANFYADVLASNVTVQDASGAQYIQNAATDYLAQRWVIGRPANLSNDSLSYTLAKQGFFIEVDQTFSNTSPVNVLFFKNPNSSSFKMRLKKFIISADSTQGIITSTLYYNPTTSANGTSATPQNCLIADPTTSTLNCFTGPTSSANGTKIVPLVINSPDTEALDMNQSIILPPSNQLLIVGQAANLGLLTSVTAHYFIQWIEI